MGVVVPVFVIKRTVFCSAPDPDYFSQRFVPNKELFPPIVFFNKVNLAQRTRIRDRAGLQHMDTHLNHTGLIFLMEDIKNKYSH